MCKFFSLLSDGNGNILYFDKDIRAKIISKKLYVGKNRIENADSHTSIAAYYNVNEDEMNKWEYDVFKKRLTIDKLNTIKDYDAVIDKVLKLDFSHIVPELIIKPIIHPFRVVKKAEITETHIELLRVWASVWASVWAYISSFFKLKWKGFEDLPENQNPFQSCIDLWEQGIVPSYDGSTWRLHSGRNADIVWQGKL